MKAIELTTYGKYHEDTDDYDTRFFSIPEKWLTDILKETYESYENMDNDKIVEDFLNRYIWDTSEVILMVAETQLREVTETCPICGAENTPFWDVGKYGFEATCRECGAKMLLCDECFHAEDNSQQKCDWCENGCFRNNHGRG